MLSELNTTGKKIKSLWKLKKKNPNNINNTKKISYKLKEKKSKTSTVSHTLSKNEKWFG